MPIANALAAHLPYLRRFARALTGSQQSGDAYVVSVLEAIVADPSIFDGQIDSRAALYRTFIKVWSSIEINAHDRDTPSPDLSDDHSERRLAMLSTKPRQAFLLSSVEGFSTAEIASILDTSESRVSALIDEAGREIAEQIAADVLIIEDEPLIAMDLEELVRTLGHRVQAIARTHTEAVAAVNKARPGLVLADIQLADGSSGLEAVNEILEIASVPTIFITAYPERLLTGQKPEPAFLITKPFQPEVVKAIISQALFFGMQSRKSPQKAA